MMIKWQVNKQFLSSTVAENKTIDFNNFSSPNSSTMVAGLSSLEFDSELKKKISDVNLFNDTDISTSTNKNTNTCLVPMNIFQVMARGCVPFYTGLEHYLNM